MTILVVPAVVGGSGRVLTQTNGPGRDRQEPVGGRLTDLPAGGPGRVGADIIQAVLTDQHRGGLQVDALMLDAHEDRPPGAVPADRQGER